MDERNNDLSQDERDFVQKLRRATEAETEVPAALQARVEAHVRSLAHRGAPMSWKGTVSVSVAAAAVLITVSPGGTTAVGLGIALTGSLFYGLLIRKITGLGHGLKQPS